MRFTILILTFILGSCAITDGYKDNQHSWYEKGLTQEEKEKIDVDGKIFKDWHSSGKNGNFTHGKLTIEKLPNKTNNYNFIEVGKWEEQFDYSTNGKTLGAIKRTVTYDSYGNIISREDLDKPAGVDEFKLLEKWNGQKKLIGSDTFLVQNIKSFQRNGQLKSEFNLLIENYEVPLSDRLKTKYKYDSAKFYSGEGKLEKTEFHSFRDKVKIK